MKKILGLALIGSMALAQQQYNFLLSDESGFYYTNSINQKVQKNITKRPTISYVKPKAYWTTLFYAGNINYESSNKDSGYVGGAYLSVFDSPFKTEMDIEQTNITYKDTTPDVTQLDVTLVVHYYEGYNLDYKFGFHYIDSTDELSDGGIVYIGGILFYKTLEYNYGVDLYYSNYSNLDTSPKIVQLTPKVGFNFGNYYSLLGSFYAEVKLDYINILDNAEVNNLDDSYFSSEYTLNNYNGNWTTSIGFWSGKRAFGVGNGGFVVNNLSDVQSGGFNFSENYKLSKVESLKFTYTYTKEDTGTKSRVYLLSYNYNF